MPAQEKLSQIEQYLAYGIGLGVVLIMGALILIGLGTGDNNNLPISILLIGLAMVVLGVAYWLYFIRPWEKFDDLKTPHFTGHDEHAHAAEESAPVHAPAPTPAPAEAAAAVTPPVPPPPAASPAPAPAEPPADNLALIEGIGPKSADALKAAGITTFAQIAAMTPAELDKAVKDHNVPLVGSTEHWPRQAEIAASGDLTALHDFQTRLKQVTLEDDLTTIEGIGPKSAAALKTAGITTFAQVAKMSPEELEKIIKDQKVRLVGSTAMWPAQAELAAKGDLTGLDALKARIKGGKLQA
jgi:predicted flap endonuclease-1-like 5' DNA nuclease